MGIENQLSSEMVRNIVLRNPLACFCSQVVWDKNQLVEDYVILEINSAFEMLIQWEREAVMQKKVSEIDENSSGNAELSFFEQLKALGNQALNSGEGKAYDLLLWDKEMYQQHLFFITDSIVLVTYQPQAFALQKDTTGLTDCFFKNTEFGRQYSKLEHEVMEFCPDNRLIKKWKDAISRDLLTGLYDRQFALSTMRMFLSKGVKPLSVIFGDVNGLKLVNESEGYQAGDALLIKVAHIFQESSRPGDVVSRWSDNGFLLVLPHTTLDETRERLNLLKQKTAALSMDNTGSRVTFGYCSNERTDYQADELVREAQKWMFRKKLLEKYSYKNNIIKLLLSMLEEKSEETQQHSERIAKYCTRVVQELKLPDGMMNDVFLLAMLHDIGKIGIEYEILNKPGKLTPEERVQIQRHPEIGYRITQNIPELVQVSEYILSHHERWDGTGYPRKLKGEEIPLISRIISVIDAFDVMVTGRSYQAPKSKEEAIAELRRCSGTQFDPTIVEIFVKSLEKEYVH